MSLAQLIGLLMTSDFGGLYPWLSEEDLAKNWKMRLQKGPQAVKKNRIPDRKVVK